MALTATIFRRFSILLVRFLPCCFQHPTISEGSQQQKVVEQLKDLTNVQGERLLYPIEEEREMYFRQLTDSWHIVAPAPKKTLPINPNQRAKVHSA